LHLSSLFHAQVLVLAELLYSVYAHFGWDAIEQLAPH
jgi:hypothetical protein